MPRSQTMAGCERGVKDMLDRDSEDVQAMLQEGRRHKSRRRRSVKESKLYHKSNVPRWEVAGEQKVEELLKTRKKKERTWTPGASTVEISTD